MLVVFVCRFVDVNIILKHHFRGRTEAKACQNCDTINDTELNKEIFDLPWKTQQNSHGTDGDTEDEVPNNGERVCGEAERSMSARLQQEAEEETEGIVLEGNRLGPIRENIPVGSQVRMVIFGSVELQKRLVHLDFR